MHSWFSMGMLIGRILISALFLVSGVLKVIFYENFVKYMESAGMTFIPFFLVAAAIIEILGGLSLLFGYKARLGAGILFLYLIPVTLIFHQFWMEADPAVHQLQLFSFLRNLAIMGGLLNIVCTGVGGWSCDHKCCCKSCHIKEQQP